MSQSTLTPFETALAWIWQAEGGLSDVTADDGGKTAYGISQYHKAAWADGMVTRAEATAIYKRDYWDARGCDRLPLVLGIAVFDGEVNHRPRTATHILQDVLGVTSDGVIGPATAAAARAALSACDLSACPAQADAQAGDLPAVLDRYLARRAVLYRDIAAADSTQAVFLEGWFWRLFRLQRYVLALEAR